MIYLALHGETVWNQQHRFQGRLDSPLTANGANQALLVGNKLRQLIDDPAGCIVMSSPLGRTMHTARTICDVIGIEPEQIKQDDRLIEIDLGSWSGLTRAEVEAKWPDAISGASRYDRYFRYLDGESLEAVTARIRSWLDEVKNLSHPVIAITHGIASQILRGLYADIPMEDAISLEIARDKIFLLHKKRIDRISCS